MDPFEFARIAAGMLPREDETGSNEEPAQRGIPQKVSGIAGADSAGGYVSIDLGGSSVTEGDLQAVEMPTDIPVKAGDEVSVEIVDGKPRVVGRIGWGDELQSVADEALEVAQATGQYFWHDTNGAHVSTEALNPTGPSNSLWNSLGLLIRKAANNLVSITQSAIAFYDGNGNNASNITAQFGSSGATIGKTGGAHMVQTSTGSTWYAPDGSTELAGINLYNNDVPMLWVGDEERRILAGYEDEGSADQVDLIDISNYAGNNSHHAGIHLRADGTDGRTLLRVNDQEMSGATLDICPSSVRVGQGVEFWIGSQKVTESDAESLVVSPAGYGYTKINGFRGRINLASTDDIDALYTTGIYYISGNGTGGTFPTGITGRYSSLICVGNGTETASGWIGRQLLLDGNDIYVRTYTNSPRTWSEWAQTVSTSVAVGSPTITNATATVFETRRQGSVVNLQIQQLKVSASLADGSTVSLGTGIIGANARPAHPVGFPLVANVAGKGAGCWLYITAAGNVTLYNRSGSALGTNTNLYGNTTWVV